MKEEVSLVICVLNVSSTDFFIFRQLSKQLEKPSRLIDHNGLQYFFNLIKPLSHIPAKAENSAKISIL